MKKKQLIIPFYINHAGCPQLCIFCDQKKISGKNHGMPQDDQINETINDYLKSWKGNGKKEVAFYGGSFTAISREIQERLLKTVYPFIKNGLIDSVRISTRPDSINEDILKSCKKYGVKTIELGIQSMDDKVLAKSGRGHSVTDSIKAAALIKKGGIKLGCQLMPGLPGDSYEKSIQTALKTVKLSPNFVRIYPALVVKGTKMEEYYRNNEYLPLELNEAVKLAAEIVNIFKERNIKIIRVGLQPTVELEKSIVAGPYHPSFGEMVKSFTFFTRITKLLRCHTSHSGKISLSFSPEDESAIRGQKNENIIKIRNNFPLYKLNMIKRDDLSQGSLVIN